jgi:cation-transporting ATPase 13A3/4/5
VVGQSVAAERLKKKGVFCVDFPRILMAGKVQVFCFDKTGTLTHEGLEYYGVYPSHQGNMASTRVVALDDEVLAMGMACCHSVTTLNGKYIGNPVDIVMFKATEATIDTVNEHDIIHTTDGRELLVLKRFEFQHARASMSIAVKDTSTNHIHLFCKGSFERIQEISIDVPINKFQEITTREAREGCYVLGMAHRDLGIYNDDLVSQVKAWTRDELESQLEYVGLILFKNLLKPDTTDAILQLKQGDVRTVMITGDNALTGVCIGQQCGMVPPNTQVILGDVSKNHASHITWTDVATNQIVSNIDPSIQSGAELALTGKAFQRLCQQDKMRDYLFATRIFARMTPTDKMVCVQFFMERAITAMCGDGGNDCGALRTAHVGIAMSEAEASVVSSFSTPHRSVQSCVELLIQGRSALATSFASYKYLIMYGETMALSKFCTFYYTLSFSQWNFILIDAFITVFCSFAVTQAGAAKRLSRHRPTARILGPEVLCSVLGQIIINGCFLAGAFVWLYTRDDFFRCWEWDSRATDTYKWWLLGDSFEADILTFIVLYQFVNNALIFNYGYIFRAPWYRNYLLLFFWSLFVAIVSFWELAGKRISSWRNLTN